jgi:hypothetical protein
MTLCGCINGPSTRGPHSSASSREHQPSTVELLRERDAERIGAIRFAGPSPAFTNNRPEHNVITDSKIFETFTRASSLNAFSCPGSQFKRGFLLGRLGLVLETSNATTRNYRLTSTAGSTHSLGQLHLQVTIAAFKGKQPEFKCFSSFLNRETETESKPKALNIRSIYAYQGSNNITILFTKNPVQPGTQLAITLTPLQQMRSDI